MSDRARTSQTAFGALEDPYEQERKNKCKRWQEQALRGDKEDDLVAKSAYYIDKGHRQRWSDPNTLTREQLIELATWLHNDLTALYKLYSDLESEQAYLSRQLDARMTNEEMERHERAIEKELRRTEGG